MRFQVSWTSEAVEDLLHLHDFLTDRALEHGTSLDLADEGIAAIEHAVLLLQTSPFSCRKAIQNPFLRELVIPFGATGYVALFEITNAHQVTVAAVRHQRESDYH
jgi:plasmid stabilization system protein ParE